MAKRRKKIDESDLVQRDGALALTFVNTGSRRSPLLQDYTDLLRWSSESGVLSAPGVLERLAAEHPDAADAAFTVAEEVHLFLSRIMNARADGKSPPTEAVHELNALFTRSVPRRILVPSRYHMVLGWPEDPEKDQYRPLWAIAWSTTTLLTSEDYDRVKRCDGKDCNVLFLAKNRGPARKWCSSQSCGSPFRSRRYYRKVTKPILQSFKGSG